MSRIRPQCLDADCSDRSARSDVLLREEPDEEEDDEEDEGNVTDDEGDDDEEDDRATRCGCTVCVSGERSSAKISSSLQKRLWIRCRENSESASRTSRSSLKIFRRTSEHPSWGSAGGCFLASFMARLRRRGASSTSPRDRITSCFTRTILRRSAQAKPKSANKSA
jgi:hypothetical protein